MLWFGISHLQNLSPLLQLTFLQVVARPAHCYLVVEHFVPVVELTDIN